jgi:squalene-associated FAD-dependent desaturase
MLKQDTRLGEGNQKRVAVVGAGAAGLAAASALAQAGYRVHLLERRPYVGGRASSYHHPSLNEVVDCQHVLLGCCTNLVHLYEQSGVADAIRWYDQLTFLEPNRQASQFAPSPLPAPMHFTSSFLGARMLGFRDKVAIARGMAEFLTRIPENDEESFAQWLKRTGQTDRARRHFWEPVVVCTLNDGFEECSTRHCAHVFRELFLRSPQGSRLGIPTIPLSDLYAGAARFIESHGGEVSYRSSVESLERCGAGWRVRTGTGELCADAVVLAVPFEQVQKLLPRMPSNDAAAELAADLARFVHSPYTTVHLWFDRRITDLHHAALLDTGIQWIFHKSQIRNYPADQGSYVELVIAASEASLEMERAEILNGAMRELALFFPEVKNARLLKSGILKEARATFSVLPGLDRLRPKQQSPWPGVFLAGDWTATDWPATMEGAARSGYLAAEAVCHSLGDERRFLQRDLRATGLMRLFD